MKYLQYNFDWKKKENILYDLKLKRKEMFYKYQ